MSNRHKPGEAGQNTHGQDTSLESGAATAAQQTPTGAGSTPEDEAQQETQQADAKAEGSRSSAAASGEDGAQPGSGAEQAGSGAGQASRRAEAADEGTILKARVAELEAELSDLKDQYLRRQAEFENSRKRLQREKEDAIAFANKQLLLDMVAIIDDFERAIQSAEESRDFDSFHDGIVLIEKQLVGMLERKWALKRFDSEGEPFDPQYHEALMTEEIPEHEQSMVLEDFQKGYLLNDRVLRSAKVKVSVPAARS